MYERPPSICVAVEACVVFLCYLRHLYHKGVSFKIMAGTVSFSYYISSAFKWASEQLLLRGCYCTNLFLLSVYFESLVRERERKKTMDRDETRGSFPSLHSDESS